jgi:multicomponent Na+:H+ antiporter subunit D
MLLMLLTARWPNLRDTVMVLTAATMFAMVLQVLPEVAAGGRPRLTLFELMPGLEIAFEVEPLGMVFALVASFLWIVTSLYASATCAGARGEPDPLLRLLRHRHVQRHRGSRSRRTCSRCSSFYEVLTLSTYPLVAHTRAPRHSARARVYLGMLLGTSICFPALAILWTWFATGTLDFTAGGILAGHVDGPERRRILLLLYMYGIGKAALMPFHRWLPAAMVAPTPVSALLHAVAVVKAGVFTVLKVVIYIFGLAYLREPVTTEWVMYIAASPSSPPRWSRCQGQSEGAARLFDGEPALLHRARRDAGHAIGGIGGRCTSPCTPSARSRCSSAPGRSGGHAQDRDQPDGRARPRMPFTLGAFFLGACA